MLQHIDKLATQTLVPRNCLRHWQTTLIMERGRLVSERMWRIVVLSWKNFLYFRKELAKLSYFSITIGKWKNFAKFISKALILEGFFKTYHLETWSFIWKETSPKVFYYEFYKVLIDINIFVCNSFMNNIEKMVECSFKMLQCLRHIFFKIMLIYFFQFYVWNKHF